MKAAATVVGIMPGHPLPLAGYTGRERRSERVASDLEANIVVLEDESSALALVSVDALFVGRTLEQFIHRSIGRPMDLALVASHTHSAPALDDSKPLLGRTDPDHLNFVGREIGQGIARVSPEAGAEFYFGQDTAPGSIYRRRNWIAVSRRPFRIGRQCVMAPNTQVRTYDGIKLVIIGDKRMPTAVLWSWPCHPVATPDADSVSADFPGAVRQCLRAHFGNETLPVLYLPGFCGDIRPDIRGSRWSIRNILRHALIPITPFGTIDPESYRSFCDRVAEASVRAAARVVPIDAGQVLRISSAQFPIGEYMAPPQDVSMGVRALRVGELSITFVGAEVCSPYYGLLHDEPDRADVLTGYTGPVFGYLPTDEQVTEGGYEVDGFFTRFGLSGRFGRRYQAEFINAVTSVRRNVGIGGD